MGGVSSPGFLLLKNQQESKLKRLDGLTESDYFREMENIRQGNPPSEKIKKYILKAMDTKVTRQDVETMLSYQADSAINKFQSAHGEPFNLLCGALRVMFQDVKESK